MDLWWVAIIQSIVSGIVIVLVEHYIIVPRRHRDRQVYTEETTTGIAPTVEPESRAGLGQESQLTNVYYPIAIGILGFSGGLASAATLRIGSQLYVEERPDTLLGAFAEIIGYSDFAFVIATLLALTAGTLLGLWVDTHCLQRYGLSFLHRVPLVLLTGFLAGLISIVILLILVTIGMILLIIQLIRWMWNNDDKLGGTPNYSSESRTDNYQPRSDNYRADCLAILNRDLGISPIAVNRIQKRLPAHVSYEQYVTFSEIMRSGRQNLAIVNQIEKLFSAY